MSGERFSGVAAIFATSELFVQVKAAVARLLKSNTSRLFVEKQGEQAGNSEISYEKYLVTPHEHSTVYLETTLQALHLHARSPPIMTTISSVARSGIQAKTWMCCQ